MIERQLIVCAGALWADGWSHDQIADALEVSREEAVELSGRAARQQAARKMGSMHSCPAADEGMIVSARDDNGNPIRSVKLR